MRVIPATTAIHSKGIDLVFFDAIAAENNANTLKAIQILLGWNRKK